MIRIAQVADSPTPEGEVAEQIRVALLSDFPDAGIDPGFQIDLIPNAFCPRQTYGEVDILLIAEFPPDTRWRPLRDFMDANGDYFAPEEILLRSLALTIEVKDHSAGSVRFDGNKIAVQYMERDGFRWHDATAQATGQAKSVAGYLRSISLRPPYVRSLLYLRNLPPHEFPRICEGTLGANLTWSNLLQVALETNPPRWSHRHKMHTVDAFALDEPDALRIDRPGDVCAVFTETLRPSEMDRHRMERLGSASAKAAIETYGLQHHFGQKLVLLRGAGGTGKTVLLLQIARYLHDTQDARVLLLTYNHALVGELFRLLVLLRINRQINADSIIVRTAHAFLGDVFDSLSLEAELPTDSENETYGEKYAARTAAALQVVQNDDATRSALHESLGFDYVLVDEGQDWPQTERDLLISLYSHENLVVAEGPGQLVRAGTRTNWRGTLKKGAIHVHKCDTCLRQKANLSRFALRFADALGLGDFGILPSPNPEAPGGRVIVYEGDYFANQQLHEELREASIKSKNSAIDFLYCVPPSLVGPASDAIMRQSRPGRMLAEWGAAVWDGADPIVRQSIPHDPDEYRVITYDSCRGLEGWTTVLLSLDDFYVHKERLGEGDGDFSKRESAGLWSLVGILRAMDTLVITLSPGDSAVRDALAQVHPDCRDFMEWRIA